VAAFTAWQLQQLCPPDSPLIRSWRYPEPEALTRAALQQQVKEQLAKMGTAAVVSKVRGCWGGEAQPGSKSHASGGGLLLRSAVPVAWA
jgi:hypothetical protein